jgi:predicted  nucleic acid-binding Zn-ribbon protein
MKTAFDKLRELQDVLLKEFEIEAELEEIPRELNGLKKRFQRVDRAIKEYETSKEKFNETIERLRGEKEGLEKNKEKFEGQIPLIKTQREYEAITSELAQIKEKLETMEEEELNAYQEFENVNKALEEQKAVHGELAEEIKDLEKKVNKAVDEKQKELKSCLKGKDKISSGLDEEIIYKFEKIVKKKEGIGIVSIKRNVCMGCNMILPPQFVNNVRKEDTIIFCPNCSRILYYHEDESEEEDAVQ